MPDGLVTLNDGATIEIRQLGAKDYDAVLMLAEHLTVRERYMRFFTTHPGYLEEWARCLTTPADGQYVLGAFEDGSLIGTANYNTTAKPGYVEVSVVIAHQQHDRGVGTTLLRTLGEAARDNGFHHLVADVLAENSSMRKVIADGGWPCRQNLDGFVVTIDVDLDKVDGE